MTANPGVGRGIMPGGPAGQRRGKALDGKVLATRVGLRFPDSLDFEHWERAGRQITNVIDSSAWCLGDWVAYGEFHYANRYRRAVDATGLDYGTLRNYASVARRFELSRRRDTLSFQHHVEVVALSPTDQENWLNQAEAQHWSRNQLRRQLRAARHSVPAPRSQRLMIAPDHATSWQAAAQQLGMTLDAWVIRTLDKAAHELLGEQSARHAVVASGTGLQLPLQQQGR